MTVGNLGVPELLIIAGVIILLFGARKLPEMARSLGKSAKAFKEETKGMRGEDKDAETPAAPPAQPIVQQQLPEAQPQTPGQPQAQTNGTQANAASEACCMTPDMRYVAFRSMAGNLGGPVSGTQKAYLRDRTAGTTTYLRDGTPRAMSACTIA